MVNYQFGSRIGGGGFGDVFEATRVDDGWKCAVKQMKPGYGNEDLSRFQREVRLQLQLNHINIVPILGANLSSNLPWFIMPRAFTNLRDYLKQKYGENEIWIFIQIASAIAFAHDNGVIHRDLEPENILLFKRETAEIYSAVADFGLGRLIQRDTPALTQTNIGMGTIQYVAPEQWENAKDVDGRADIFSLGKILYEILTGEIPFPIMYMNLVPRQFVYIVQKVTSDDPEKRYQNVGSMLNDLDFVARRHEDFEEPANKLLLIVEDLMAGQTIERSSLENLVQILCENTDDDKVAIQVLPRIPDPVLEQIVKNNVDSFRIIVQAYDEKVSGSLAFSYCDVVADFYEKVFEWTNDFAVRELILRRLPTMGYHHNRWYVGKVFGRIISSLQDPPLQMVARDVLQEDSNITE